MEQRLNNGNNMGNYISIGLVLQADKKVFISKCKHIIANNCSVSLAVFKYPIDDSLDRWEEYVVNPNDLFLMLDKCYQNEFAEFVIDYTAINSYHIKGMIVKIIHLINGYTGILFEIPEANFDKIPIDELENVVYSILVGSLKIGFSYAFCDNECSIEYTLEEIVNQNIQYSILVYDYEGKIYSKYAKWKIDGLSSRF